MDPTLAALLKDMEEYGLRSHNSAIQKALRTLGLYSGKIDGRHRCMDEVSYQAMAET